MSLLRRKFNRLSVIGLLACLPAAVMLSPRIASADGSSKAVTIYVNPLTELFSAIIGATDFSGGIDVRFARFMTIGVIGDYFNWGLTGVSSTGWDVGPRLNFYLRGDAIGDSWYISPFAQYASVSVTDAGASSTATFYQGTVLIGYHWVWNGGFNMRLGLGASYSNVPSSINVGGTDVSTSSNAGAHAAGEFSLGWAF